MKYRVQELITDEQEKQQEIRDCMANEMVPDPEDDHGDKHDTNYTRYDDDE